MPASEIATSSAGSTFSICLSLPATETEAGYEALTFIEVGEVTNIGEFSRVYNAVTTNNLSQRQTKTLKGSYTEGTPPIAVNFAPGDDGQDAAYTALSTDDNVSFKVTTQDGTTFYNLGLVMSMPVTIGGVDDVTSAVINVTFNGAMVRVLPA